MIRAREASVQDPWNERHERFYVEFHDWMDTRWSAGLVDWKNATATGHDTMRLPFQNMLPATPSLDTNPGGEVFETPRCLFHGTPTTRLFAILAARRLVRGARYCTHRGVGKFGINGAESEATALLYAYPAPLPSSDECYPQMKVQCVLELKAYRATKVTQGKRPKIYLMREPWLQLEALHITLWHANSTHRDIDYCSHPDAEEIRTCKAACTWNDFFLDWNPKPPRPVYTDIPRATTSTLASTVQSHGTAAPKRSVTAPWRSARDMSASSRGYDSHKPMSSSPAICDESSRPRSHGVADTKHEVQLPWSGALMKLSDDDDSGSHRAKVHSSEQQESSSVHSSIDELSSTETDHSTPCNEEAKPSSAMTDAGLAIFELHVVSKQNSVKDSFLKNVHWNYDTMTKHLGCGMSQIFRQGLESAGIVQRMRDALNYILIRIQTYILRVLVISNNIMHQSKNDMFSFKCH